MSERVVPLIINGNDVVLADEASQFLSNGQMKGSPMWKVQGATPALCKEALQSSEAAFPVWRRTKPFARQNLIRKVADLLRARTDELVSILEDEIGCSAWYASSTVPEALGILDQVGALCTSNVMSGFLPLTLEEDALAMVFKDPLGVILSIAPWNNPVVLGLRAICAAVGAGNCVVFKGSELSPRAHYFTASLFRDAGFPPGVVNFLLHKRDDAASTFATLISHPAVRKCNFTGSEAVGRVIASEAGRHLKPVLLELGGKNFALVLDDADLESAATDILEGALKNSGQVCMSTDIVLVSRKLQMPLTRLLRDKLYSATKQHVTHVISQEASARLSALLYDAETKGATIKSLPSSNGAIIEGLSRNMDFWVQESFAPVVGIATYETVNEAVDMMNSTEYGLSHSIFSTSKWNAVEIARKISAGAVHINGPTTHDGPALPHGGHKNSGFGRFGDHWGFEEFTHTHTIIVNGTDARD